MIAVCVTEGIFLFSKREDRRKKQAFPLLCYLIIAANVVVTYFIVGLSTIWSPAGFLLLLIVPFLSTRSSMAWGSSGTLVSSLIPIFVALLTSVFGSFVLSQGGIGH